MVEGVRMKKRYKILNSKTCEGIDFRIVYDPDGIGSWHYKIQYETDYKNKYKKLWNFQKLQDATNEFDCDNMLKRIYWLRR